MQLEKRSIYVKVNLFCVIAALVLSVAVSAWAVEISSGIFNSLDDLVVEGMAQWNIPGVAYCVVSGDKIVHRACFGVRKKGESGQNWLIDEKTVFQIGSTTKAFTSAMIAMLVDEDKLVWNDRVTAVLPGFRLKDPFAWKDFRLFDLMSQHSGLPSHSLDGMPLLGYGRSEVLKALRFVESYSPLRSEYAYQNVFYLCSASIIEKITGKTWEENLRTRIFRPLAMDSAGSTFKEFTSRPERIAWLHRLKGGDSEILPMDWPWQDWVYVFGPAGSISLNIDDFGRWLGFQISGGFFESKRLISKKEMDFLIKPQTLVKISDKGSVAYCQGWVREIYGNEDLIWHNGATLGAHSIIAFIPDKKVGIAVLTNQVGNSLPEAMMKTFVDLLSGESSKKWVKVLSKKEKNDKPVRSRSLQSLRDPDRYVGIYESPIYGRLLIDRKDEGLTAYFMSPKAQTFKLDPWSRDVFSTKWDVFGGSLNFIRFHQSDDKKSIDAVTVEMVDDDPGSGTFRRLKKAGGY